MFSDAEACSWPDDVRLMLLITSCARFGNSQANIATTIAGSPHPSPTPSPILSDVDKPVGSPVLDDDLGKLDDMVVGMSLDVTVSIRIASPAGGATLHVLD